MPSAEIITIGTELLLGETKDTNTQFLARGLNKAGFDVFRTTVVGDNQKRITQAISESLTRAELVITAGGLGPTIDDPTRQAAADVFKEKLIFKKNLWEKIQKRFESTGRIPTENNRRQAFIPTSAEVIENPVGTAPAFYMQQNSNLLICLPGVPAEMKHLFENFVLPLIIQKFNIHLTILSQIMHTTGLGESKVDELINDLEKLGNPTVGLSAYPGQVDIRITAKAADEESANKLILPIVIELEKRLGNNVFGKGEDNLIDKVLSIKKNTNKRLLLFINNVPEELSAEIIKTCIFDQVFHKTADVFTMENEIQKMYNNSNLASAGIDITTQQNKTSLLLLLASLNGLSKETRYFSSHPSLISQWAFNSFLDFLRRHLT